MGRDRLESLRQILHRSRTFLSRHKSSQEQENESQNNTTILVINAEEVDYELSKFLCECTHIQDSLKVFQQDIENIKVNYEESLSLPNYAPDDCNARKIKFDDLEQKLNAEILDIKSSLKDLKFGTQSVNLRIKRTQEAALYNTFGNLVQSYHNVQIKYQDDCKKRIKRQLEIAGRFLTDEELENRLEDGRWEIFTQEVEMENAKFMLEKLNSRHDYIMKLEKSIKELHRIFVEISEIVTKQGETIDSIDVLIVDTQENVTNGKNKLKKANKRNKKYLKKKIGMGITVAALSVIAITLIIIL